MEPPLTISLTISFFFHGRGAEIQKTPLGLYRSLLYQLLERFPKALSHVVHTFKSNCAGKGMPGERWNWHVQELRDFVESSLAKILEESAIQIFVDALDECGEEEARRLVRYFERLYSKTYFAPHGLSICFSCRHWPVIAPDECQEICAEHENHEDIRTYIEEELQSVVHDPEERATLQDKIEARSESVFQWVVLVMPRIVEMCRDGKTIRQCLEVLKEIPQDLNDLYETIIHSLKRRDQDQSMKLFQWICFARRPLSIAELRCAMNVDANPAYQSFQGCKKLPGYIETDTQMEKQLRSLSGGLAEWKNHGDGRVAQLVHQSVNDYLISKGFYHFDTSLDSVDKTVGCSHSRLSRSCIVYFAMDEIERRQHNYERFIKREDFIDRQGMEILFQSFQSDESRRLQEGIRTSLREEYPFLDYALTSWLPYAQIAEEQGIPQNDLLQYLQRHSAWTMQLWVGLCRLTRVSMDFRVRTTVLHVASAYNLTRLVSAILYDCEQHNVDADSRDGYGETPLSRAAGRGHDAVVKLLLAQPNVDVNSKDTSLARTPLSWAAKNGHEAVVKLLLAQPDVDINSDDLNAETPLFHAAEEGQEGVIKLLLAHPGIDINTKDVDSETPLTVATGEGHEGVIKLLQSKGARFQ